MYTIIRDNNQWALRLYVKGRLVKTYRVKRYIDAVKVLSLLQYPLKSRDIIYRGVA